MSDVQKLIYLKSFLKKEPLQLINNLEVIGSNFKVALDILCDRFENKYLIINSYLKNLINIPNLTKNNAHTLREFFTQIKQIIAALDNFNIKEKLTDLILINIFSQKLDFNLRKSFETERNINELPTLQEFFAFIEKKCKVLENLISDERRSFNNPVKNI